MRFVTAFRLFGLAAFVAGLAAASAQSAPPWRQPGWDGDSPAERPAPVERSARPATTDEPARPATTDEPARDQRDTTAPPAGVPVDAGASANRLFGRAVTFVAQQSLETKAAPCPGCLVLRSDAARVVIADNGAEHPTVRVFAAYPGGVLRERGYLLGHLSPVTALLLTDDFRILATTGGGTGAGGEAGAGEPDDSLRLWNADALNRRTPGLKLRHGAPTALAAAPDGKRFAVGDATGHVTVFRDRHGRQRGDSTAVGDGPVGAVALTPDGATVYAAVGRRVHVLRARPAAVRDGAPALVAPGGVTALAVMADGTLLVGDAGGSVTALEPSRGAALWTARTDGAIRRIRPVPDERSLLVAADGAPAPLVLDAGSGAPQATIRARHESGLVDVAVDLDTGLVALAHRDGVVELWRLAGAPNPDSWR